MKSCYTNCDLLTAIWLALATYLELPVSSQQSIQGALLGTIIVTEGFDYIPIWNKVRKIVSKLYHVKLLFLLKV